MEAITARLDDRRSGAYFLDLAAPGDRYAFAIVRPGVEPREGERWAVALVSTRLPDGTRVTVDTRAKHRACCRVLAHTEEAAGTDLTELLGCTPGV